MRMGLSSFNQQSNHRTMDELVAEADVDSISSCSSRVSSVESSDSSDLMDEATSSLSPSPPPSSSSASTASPLHDMSALMNQLPLKRGLSKHFQGKSQSFTSLANVRCLEDLAKPENPCNKKLKSCKSYGGLSSSLLHRTISSSRFVLKKASSNSRVSCSSVGAKRTPSFLGNKPPMPPPHRSTTTSSISNHTPLFA